MIRLKLLKTIYSRESLEAGALVLGEKVKIFLKESGKFFVVEMRGSRKASGEFLNEALNHQYRQKVVKFNSDLSGAVLSRLFAQGFPAEPADPLEELEPQVKKDRARDLADLLETAGKL